ncbi:MAG: glutamine--tRNA ligase/YqeY domain fusion protein [Bacteroidales bacterium]|nr:glutamine--tRNA ligase/YqeY domain fusion protein [Bacteroidales bacterium]
MKTENPEPNEKSLNFIEQIIEEDLQSGKHTRIHTRFPPEPNGYLHIGHAKSICLNFGLALKYGGLTNLRFDDTNPVAEDVEYVDSIREDVKWLGFDWEDREYYASDYFDTLYEYAIKLIKKGKAYVCELSPEEISSNRGTPTRPGIESPFRNRSVEENLKLFEDMKKGLFQKGERVLRAKIDMASPNMHMRDPIIYRIIHTHHHRTGDKWCIYPSYDFAHGQCDSLENITHSICTLEFEVHRPLYEWFIKELEIFPSRQIEFARLNLTYTVMSKRKLLQLVEEKYVSGWDDPRMPTISGFRRRGYTAASIRNFAERIGVAKRDNVIDVALLEFSLRDDLNKIAPRAMAVINPVKLIITNYPADKTEIFEAKINPEDENSGKRHIPFTNTLYIERDDFMENPPDKFFRLSVGKEVRLKYAYIIKCESIVKDASGEITEIHCTYDPDTKSGSENMSRKVKGTIHWVSVKDAAEIEVRLFDRLFITESPDDVEEGKTFKDYLNSNALNVLKGYVEPFAKNVNILDKFQFERLGYFCVDKDSTKEKIVFNRTVTLKDTWAKVNKNA